MDRTQRVKMINILYSLTPEHAQKVGQLIEAELLLHAKSIDDEVHKNRTMHEMARAMHVISDSDNTAALSKALGRYSRLELDREHSKLNEEIEVKPIFRPYLSLLSDVIPFYNLGLGFRMETTDNHI